MVAVYDRERLRHVYWIGGGSGAGKSTVARRLCAEHGLRVYSTDDAMRDHVARLPPREAPFLAEFLAMDMDERWCRRSPEVMLDTFHWFRGEGFALVVDDLLALAPQPTVAEGFRLLPHLVAPLLAEPAHSVWLLPTPAFRRAALHSRGSTWAIPRRTTAPHRALRNLLIRDGLCTDRLAAQTRSLGLPAVHVEVGMGKDDLTWRVTKVFGLPTVRCGS